VQVSRETARDRIAPGRDFLQLVANRLAAAAQTFLKPLFLFIPATSHGLLSSVGLRFQDGKGLLVRGRQRGDIDAQIARGKFPRTGAAQKAKPAAVFHVRA
jgi:hypothetical protein